jgi:hypothetical protein
MYSHQHNNKKVKSKKKVTEEIKKENINILYLIDLRANSLFKIITAKM